MAGINRRDEIDTSQELKYKVVLDPIKEPNHEPKRISRRPKKRLLIILGILLSLIVAGGLILWFFVLSAPSVKVNPEVRQAAGVSVVIPVKLLSGYSVSEEPAFDGERKLVLTRFANKSGDFIVLSQQQKPKDVSLKQIDSEETYLDKIGTVYVLKGEKGRIQAIIETSDSWVYVDGSDSVGLPTIKAFISNLGTPE